MLDGALPGGIDRADIHAVDLLAGNAERHAALREIRLRGSAADRCSHGVTVVLDHVDDRQLPQLRHVEALVDLALVGRAVTEIGQAHIAVLAVMVGEGDAGAEGHLRADDAVAAIEMLLLGEHVHGAALALRQAAATAGQLGHDAPGFHSAGQHVPVVAIAGDHLIAGLRRKLHADDDRFLTDIEMTEPADEAHAVHLPGLLLEAADEQHFPVGVEILVLVELGRIGDGFASRILDWRGLVRLAGSNSHRVPPKGFLDESCSAVD